MSLRRGKQAHHATKAALAGRADQSVTGGSFDQKGGSPCSPRSASNCLVARVPYLGPRHEVRHYRIAPHVRVYPGLRSVQPTSKGSAGFDQSPGLATMLPSHCDALASPSYTNFTLSLYVTVAPCVSSDQDADFTSVESYSLAYSYLTFPNTTASFRGGHPRAFHPTSSS